MFKSADESREFALGLRTSALGRHMNFSERTHSTNDLALEAGRSGAEHGTVFATDFQSAGRGRRGRHWDSPAGTSLLFSVLIRPNTLAPENLGWIPLVAGFAAAEVLRGECGVNVAIKWPNDLVIPCASPLGWKKLGGILCESVLPASGPAKSAGGFVVVGIGININQAATQLPPAGKSPATSIRLENGALADRQTLLASILENLESRLSDLQSAESIKLKESISRHLEGWLEGRSLLVRSPAGVETAGRAATFAGLDTFGRLRVFQDGIEQTLTDAEIIGLAIDN